MYLSPQTYGPQKLNILSGMAITFHIQTFGCQMNASDSDWLCRSLKARGFVEGPFEKATLYIINTCSVRDKPEQKVYSELGRIARHCKVNKREGITVCVGGCVAQQVGPKLVSRFPQVRLMFGTDGIARAPEAISRLMEEPKLRLSLLDFIDHYEERADARIEAFSARKNGLPAAESGPDAANEANADDKTPAAAFVNIMQGCDNYCTYCIVPYVRGRQKSRKTDAILRECAALIESGAREITLLGQNVNSFGQDKEGDGVSFAELLYKVAALPGLERLRFVTPHPKDIAPEVIEAFAELKNLCPRLHLPLQSGSDRILKAMNRRYDTARYLDIVSRLRKARPDILLTTDIIVGFPGETEEDFEATMRIMREAGFASSFSFVYSDRPHAKAVLLPGKVERTVALERLARLQEWQNQTSDGILENMVGKTSIILIEGKSRWNILLDEHSPPAPQREKDDCRANAGQTTVRRKTEAPRQGDLPLEAWQGKTPQGFIVNVNLAGEPVGNYPARGWEGAMLPVRIEASAKHSLKGIQAGTPW